MRDEDYGAAPTLVQVRKYTTAPASTVKVKLLKAVPALKRGKDTAGALRQAVDSLTREVRQLTRKNARLSKALERSQEHKDTIKTLRRKVETLRRRLKRAARPSPPRRASAKLRKALERSQEAQGHDQEAARRTAAGRARMLLLRQALCRQRRTFLVRHRDRGQGPYPQDRAPALPPGLRLPILAHQNKMVVRHGDETGWRIQALSETGRSRRAWLWISVGKDAVYYHIDPSRSAEAAMKLFGSVTLNGIDVLRWLEAWLEACAENGGKPPDDLSPWLPWTMSEERRRELTAPG